MARSPRRPPSTSRRDRPRQHRSHRRTSDDEDLLPRRQRRDGGAVPPLRHYSKTTYLRSDSSTRDSHTLSEGSLAKLDALNEKLGWNERESVQYQILEKDDRGLPDQGQHRSHRVGKRDHRRPRRDERDHNHYQDHEKRRVISGPLLEQGKDYTYHHELYKRGGEYRQEEQDDERRRKRRKRLWILLGVVALILIVVIPVGVSVSRNKSQETTEIGGAATSSSKPSNSNLGNVDESSIPAAVQGTYLDPFTWYDTTDFNVTYTDATVGGLSVMGLNSTWNDNVRANSNVPPLTQKWAYGTTPVRGMNLGGWLSLEPFITPSLFNQFTSDDKVIDEWTLCSKLGPTKAASILEEHYSSFINEQTFVDMRGAGFDHVRIPYSYWAVTTYEGDPYVPKTSWRYLLRGIEWARKNGLRINLDLHALPGSQNGWNHSGRQGVIGWLNGTDGDLNAQRSLDLHQQLSTFFAQPRYTNLVTMYGLANEPKMTAISTESVVSWTESAIQIVRSSGMPTSTVLVFGDGFLGLANWQGKLQGYPNLLLDAHQYVIFNVDQIVLDHTAKINFACEGWTQQTQQSMSAVTGYGTFLCGEWSQADTDCVDYLNNVGVGSRWEGTLNTGNATTSVLTPTCPTANDPRCNCDSANADPASYSAGYKQWLLMFAEAQMHSFELGWGWFYWTWQTETAVQWSWKAGMAAGTLPKDARFRSFSCNSTVPDFGTLGLLETY